MRFCFSREGCSGIRASHFCWYDTGAVKISVQPYYCSSLHSLQVGDWVLLALGDSVHLHEYISFDQPAPRLWARKLGTAGGDVYTYRV